MEQNDSTLGISAVLYVYSANNDLALQQTWS
jgi:hypothetical protein